MMAESDVHRQSMEGAPPAYFPHLDGLRTVAISMVVIEHFGGPLAGFLSAGYYGVDLFFVISGFLITSILIRNTDDTFGGAYKRFMGRRALRIFPVYYLAVLILWTTDFPQARDNFFYLATYTWNYAIPTVQGENYLFYLWSLSVEEQFYLFWPLIALSLRNRLKILFFVTAAMVVIGYAQLLANLFPPLKPFNYVGLLNRMGSLGLGGLGAVAVQLRWVARWLYQSVSLEIAAFALLVWALCGENEIRLPFMGISSLFLVIKSVVGEFQIPGIGSFLASAPITYIGRISYGIYVYHWPVGVVLTWFLFDPVWAAIPFSSFGTFGVLEWHSWLIKLPLFFGISIFLAHFSHRFFEQPLLKFKDQWFPPKRLTLDPDKTLHGQSAASSGGR